MMYIISVNSRDGKPVSSPFVVETLDGVSNFIDRAYSVGAVVIIDSIASFSSLEAARISTLFDSGNCKAGK